MEVLGFHDIDDNIFTEDDYSFTETYYDAQNVLNILGWFPVLGSVIGGIRIISTGVMYVGDNESHKHYHKKYFAISGLRGGIEMFSLGWVFIIPDLVASGSKYRNVSMKRAFRKKNKK